MLWAGQLNSPFLRRLEGLDSKTSWDLVKRLHAVLKKEFALLYEIEAADDSIMRQGDRKVVRSRSEIRAELSKASPSEPRG